MTLVTTITHHELWKEVLKQNTFTTISGKQDITDDSAPYCITLPLSLDDIDALRIETQRLLITYVSPDITVANLLEEGKGLDEALSIWKSQTLELLTIHKKQRRKIHLLNLEELTQLTRQGLENLKNIGWPLFESVSAVPSSIYRVIAAQALIQDDELNELASLLFVSSCKLSSKPLELNLSYTLNRCRKSSRASDERDKDQQTEKLLINQLFKVQEELENYYLKYESARKSIDYLTRDNKKLKAKTGTQKQKLDELSQKINMIQSSVIWKLTKPLRVVKDAIAGTKNNLKENIALLSESKFFDEKWYLEINTDVQKSNLSAAEHYLLYGAKEGRNPSREFDNNWYLNQYPDVAESGLNPLVHFLKYGQKEKRTPSPRYINRNTAIK